MFCPKCGSQEKDNNQYCRTCGAELGSVRSAVALRGSTGDLTRSDVGRAILARIAATQSGKELAKVSNEVAPVIEKLLESPEERRLRRIRHGSITAFVGLGTSIGMAVAATFNDPDLFVLSGLGMITFFIGMALMVNGYFFSVTSDVPKSLEGASDVVLPEGRTTSDLSLPEGATFGSVTENTTKTLDKRGAGLFQDE
ncbi:MAG: hypothetical protein R2684_12045 [Pyrinomonadaceae bacterium]